MTLDPKLELRSCENCDAEIKALDHMKQVTNQAGLQMLSLIDINAQLAPPRRSEFPIGIEPDQPSYLYRQLALCRTDVHPHGLRDSANHTCKIEPFPVRPSGCPRPNIRRCTRKTPDWTQR